MILAQADPDADDVFAVRIRQDKVFGTPIFETVGGVSQCPGESGTTKKDSFITIAPSLQYYCATPLCQDIPYGTKAYVGIVIQNLSPVVDQRFPNRNTAQYRLFTATTVSPFRSGAVDRGATTNTFCGTPGYARGLRIRQDGESTQLQEPGVLLNLPYGQTEVILEVETNFGSGIECLEYTQIPIILVSDCEYNSATYQYKTELDPDTKDPTVRHPVFDLETTDWIPDTLPNFPNRATTDLDIYKADSVSIAYLDVSWAGLPTPPPTTGPTAKPMTPIPSESPDPTPVPTMTPSADPSSVPTPVPSRAPRILVFDDAVHTTIVRETPDDACSSESDIVQVREDVQGLLKFPDLAIPPGATVVTAELTVYTAAASSSSSSTDTRRLQTTTPGFGFDVTAHRMLRPWSEATTWNSISRAGILTNNRIADITPSLIVDPTTPGLTSFDVTASAEIKYSFGRPRFSIINY